ncbi:MAG: protein kinase [Hyphomicrobiaceae bacterium]
MVALEAGTVLADDFEIERVLGAGGFGITYLATERALHRHVTIKEYFPSDFAIRGAGATALPRSSGREEDFAWGLSRFIDEARTLARFNHPNIVKVYRYFEENETAYMVLHFEQGPQLRQWLKDLGRTVRQEELDAIAGPLLHALETLHAADFLHRDIAPDNIIIRPDGSPVLIDFGSARGDIARQSRTVSALVKPGYSPFEQYGQDGIAQGPWTDIYALAATLYQAVTGKRPPDSPTRMIKDDLRPAREAAVGAFRQDFLVALDRALSLEIAARPQSVAAWRHHLLREPTVLVGPAAAQQRKLGFGAATWLARRKKAAPATPPMPDATPETAIVEISVPRAGGSAEIAGQSTVRSAAPSGARAAPGDPTRQAEPSRAAKGQHRANGAAPTAEQAPASVRRRSKPARALLARIFGRKENHAVEPRRSTASLRRTGLRTRLARELAARDMPVADAAVADTPKAPRKGALVVASRADPPANRKPAKPRRRRSSSVAGLMLQVAAVATIVGSFVAIQQMAPQFGIDREPQDAAPATTERRAPVSGRSTAARSEPTDAPGASARAEPARPPRETTTGQSSTRPADEPLIETPRVRPVERRLAALSPQQVVEPGPNFLIHQFQPHPGGVQHVRFANQGRWIVTTGSDRRLKIWDAATGNEIGLIELDFGMPTALASVGTIAVTGHATGEVVVWDLALKVKREVFKRNEARIWSVSILDGGKAFAAASHDWKVALWSAGVTDAPIYAFEGHDNAVQAIARSINSDLIVSASADRSLRLWDVRRLSLVRSYRGHPEFVTAAALSQDGERLASGDLSGEIRVWSVGSGQRLRRIKAHDGEVIGVGFLGDRNLLASAGKDGRIRVWNLRNGRAIETLGSRGSDIVSFDPTPDHREIAVALADGWVRVWDVSELRP